MEKLNDKQKWDKIDIAIKAFLKQYPEACELFFKEMSMNRSEYGLSVDKGLQKSHMRLKMSFPVVRSANGDDDCLLPIIERIMPELKVKGSPYYNEFIKRYPKFSASEKI